MHLRSISSLIAKSMNTYLHKIFPEFFFYLLDLGLTNLVYYAFSFTVVFLQFINVLLNMVIWALVVKAKIYIFSNVYIFLGYLMRS